MLAPTTSGALTSRASSRPATAFTAIRSLDRRLQLRYLLIARVCSTSVQLMLSPSSPGCSRNTGCHLNTQRQRRTVLPPPPWRACRCCRRGGVRLGILPDLIEPGKTAAEWSARAHARTLKAETTRPPAQPARRSSEKFATASPRGIQQRAAARGAGHGDAGICLCAIAAEMPDRLPPLEYPDRSEVRYVSDNGDGWNRGGSMYRAPALANTSAREEIDDGVWNVGISDPLKLGRLLSGTCGSRMNLATLKRRRRQNERS